MRRSFRINEWLEGIGRPELKLSVNEVIEMILA